MTLKTSCLILMILFLASLAHASGDRSWHDRYFDKEWVLTPTPDEVLVLYRDDATAAQRAVVVQNENLTDLHAYNELYRTAVYTIATGESAESAAARLSGRPEIEACVPAVRDQEGFTKYYIPEQLTVQFPKHLSDVTCRAHIADAGSEVIQDYWTPGYYRITTPADQDVFAAIRAWYDRSTVLFAEPAYMCYNDALHVPNDPLFPDQWHLRNTGQGSGWTPGADVQAVDAWDISTGNPNVLVVVIDTGMDLSHEDLMPNLLPRLGEDWDFADGGDTSPDDEGDHGTACSGIAVGVQDNGLGVSGIAPNCQIMPLRINLSSGMNANRADAINYAASRRAEFDGLVMSNSWKMSSGDFSAVEAAVQNADALDCVVCFASGNDNGAVSYPAKYPETIAVGASSPCDERKSPSSCDGESFWGSNYGAEQDVVAPGVIITTTDRSGGVGYSSGDYYSSFNGTSSACPLAAGICALIYSVNPSLTHDEVRQILRDTAEDEVGPPAEDTPGWDPYMGWGRVNAYEAVVAASTGFGQLAGNVTNASNGGTPLEGATVLIEQAEVSGQTNAEGDYLIHVQPGIYYVTASHPSFDPATYADIEIVSGEVFTLNFSLADIGGPAISEVTEHRSTEDEAGPYPTEATVTDFSALSAVDLTYRVNGGPWNTLPMSSAGGDLYAIDIPGQSYFAHVEYYVRAEDIVNNEAVDPPGAPADVYDFWVAPKTDLLAEDNETGAPDWTHEVVSGGFIDQWHLSTTRNHTPAGTTSWKCGDTGAGDYGNLLDAGLLSPPFLLDGLDTQLTYWQWIDAEVSGSYPGYAYDGGIVELSIDGGPFVQIFPEGGYTFQVREGGTPGPFEPESWFFSGSYDWHEVVFDLSGFSGTAQLRWRFGSDGSAAGEGWYVDDVLVDGFVIDYSDAPEQDRVQARLQLLMPDPNPFTSLTVLRYQLPRTSDVLLRVFNLEGRVVRTLAVGSQNAGWHTVTWDGRDDEARPVASGVYLTHLTMDKSAVTRKIMLAR